MVVDRRHPEDALAGALVDRTTWMMTDSASTTNSPPMIASTISWWVATAIAPSAPPSARLPVSPMNTAAGGALNHRKARPAPTIAEQQHGQLAGAEHMRDAEIVGEARVADEIGDQQEGERGDDHRHGRQPVEPVGQVHRIAEGDDRRTRRTTM